MLGTNQLSKSSGVSYRTKLIVAVLGAFALFLPCASVEGQHLDVHRTSYHGDLHLTIEINKALLSHKELKRCQPGVRVNNQVATVFGPMPSTELIKLTLQVVRSVPGIRKIRNQLHLGTAPDAELQRFPTSGAFTPGFPKLEFSRSNDWSEGPSWKLPPAFQLDQPTHRAEGNQFPPPNSSEGTEKAPLISSNSPRKVPQWKVTGNVPQTLPTSPDSAIRSKDKSDLFQDDGPKVVWPRHRSAVLQAKLEEPIARSTTSTNGWRSVGSYRNNKLFAGDPSTATTRHQASPQLPWRQSVSAKTPVKAVTPKANPDFEEQEALELMIPGTKKSKNNEAFPRERNSMEEVKRKFSASLLATVNQIQRNKPQFQQVQVWIEDDGAVYLRGIGARDQDVQLFAQTIARVPGVQDVIIRR
ncbi:MAG: BON domain-containing protein [Gemmataceae bacterium]